MNLAKVGLVAKRFVSRGGLKVQKYSPELLLAAGLVGLVGSAIWACKKTASPKFVEIKKNYEYSMDEIKTCIELNETEAGVEYTAEDGKKDRVIVKVKAVKELGALYWKPATLGFLSVCCIIGGHRIMHNRNVGLIAAYKLVDEAFKNYRARVRGELGDDADKKFLYDTDEIVSENTIVDEDGKKRKVKSTTQVLKGETVSMYARLFDENNNQWSANPDFNWLFLKKKRDYLNDRLRVNGHVFLNEAYDELDFPHTPEGAVVGWVNQGDGDGYISFGPWCEPLLDVEAAGRGSTILLDFNVDGVMYDLI